MKALMIVEEAIGVRSKLKAVEVVSAYPDEKRACAKRYNV